MSYQSKEFKALKKKWYKKLEKSGFEDIEVEDPDTKEFALKWSATQNFSTAYYRIRRDSGLIEAKQTYYRLAGFFLHDYEFKYKAEKLIWKWHSEGIAIRTISTKLKQDNIKIANTQVKECIHRLRTKMLKKYESEES